VGDGATAIDKPPQGEDDGRFAPPNDDDDDGPPAAAPAAAAAAAASAFMEDAVDAMIVLRMCVDFV